MGAAALVPLLATPSARDLTARPGIATRSLAQLSARGTWCSAPQSSASGTGAPALSCAWLRTLRLSAPASAPLAAPARLAFSCTTPAACPAVSAPASCVGSSTPREHRLSWIPATTAPVSLVRWRAPQSPAQSPVAGAPGPRGVFAAAAVMWAFGGASGQALRPPLPSGVLRARALTWRPNSAACGRVGGPCLACVRGASGGWTVPRALPPVRSSAPLKGQTRPAFLAVIAHLELFC